MRTPSLLADFIYARVCKPICEKLLTLPSGQNVYNKPDPGGLPASMWKTFLFLRGYEVIFRDTRV